jgi:manganese/iron transport system substrate-binding protein
MARNVAGDVAIVESITKAGAEIHGYQPTPRDIIKAQDADLILWNGLNLELWFEQFFSNLRDIPSVVITKGIKPISISEGEYSGKPNPHAWMSYSNALIYVDNIRDAFILNDPENKASYVENANVYKKQIKEAITPLRDRIMKIAPQQRWLVSCEGAFSYLIHDFKMRELYLWPINADGQGTPQQIRRVIDTVRKNNIPAVFCESTVSQSPAKQIANETGSKYGGVLYVDSLTIATGKVPTYLDLLRITSETIASGLEP